MPDEAPSNEPQPQIPSESPSQEGGTAVAERPAPKPAPQRPKTDHLPPYKVLLHNDDVNDMVWVIRSIVELTPHNVERAIELTTEADKTGVALVLVTHQERAELYQDQFQSKGLTVTIEPAE